MIKARYYQTILSYEVTQHLMNSRKFVIQEAFNVGKGTNLIKQLPFEGFLQLVESNVPMIFNFTVAVNTSAKVSVCFIDCRNTGPKTIPYITPFPLLLDFNIMI